MVRSVTNDIKVNYRNRMIEHFRSFVGKFFRKDLFIRSLNRSLKKEKKLSQYERDLLYKELLESGEISVKDEIAVHPTVENKVEIVQEDKIEELKKQLELLDNLYKQLLKKSEKNEQGISKLEDAIKQLNVGGVHQTHSENQIDESISEKEFCINLAKQYNFDFEEYSFGEKALERLLKKKGIEFYKQFPAQECKHLHLDPSEKEFQKKINFIRRFDFFLPDENLVIEYDGYYHENDEKLFKSDPEKMIFSFDHLKPARFVRIHWDYEDDKELIKSGDKKNTKNEFLVGKDLVNVLNHIMENNFFKGHEYEKCAIFYSYEKESGKGYLQRIEKELKNKDIQCKYFKFLDIDPNHPHHKNKNKNKAIRQYLNPTSK